MSWRARLRDERGYTLIEMLVATIAGLLVSGAAMSIVVGSYQFLTNDADRVDSNQQGRDALRTIEQDLNSACVAGPDVSPIVGGTTGGTGAPPSGADSLTFYSTLSDTPGAEPSELVVFLNGSGQLELDSYAYSSGAEPNWTFATTTSSKQILLAHAATVGGAPIFTYYGYSGTGTTGLTGTTGATGTLSDQFALDSNQDLPASSAANTSAVGIQFAAEPSDGNSATGDAVALSDQVVLRLSPAANITAGSATPPNTPLPCD